MRTRLLGTIGVVASPAFLLWQLHSGFVPTHDRLGAVLGLVFVVGWVCSAVGLRVAGATGRAGDVLLAIQLAGLALAAAQQVQDYFSPSAPPATMFYAATDAAWPLSVLFMLVVGGFTAAAGVLRGWRRWAPLLCGLVLPLLFLTNATLGSRAGGVVFGVGTCVAWGLLGMAVRSAGDAGGLTTPGEPAPPPTAPSRVI